MVTGSAADDSAAEVSVIAEDAADVVVPVEAHEVSAVAAVLSLTACVCAADAEVAAAA